MCFATVKYIVDLQCRNNRNDSSLAAAPCAVASVRRGENGLLHSSIVVIVQSIRFNARFNICEILARPIARTCGNAVIAEQHAACTARCDGIGFYRKTRRCDKRNYKSTHVIRFFNTYEKCIKIKKSLINFSKQDF